MNDIERQVSDLLGVCVAAQPMLQAVDALAAIGPAAVPPLIEALRSPNAKFRIAAGRALIKIGVPAVPVLVGLLECPEEALRKLAALLLGEIGPDSKSAVPLLRVMLAKDDASGCRGEAARALGKIEPDAAETRAVLLGALEDESSFVQEVAAAVLGAIAQSSTATVAALATALASSQELVRSGATKALEIAGPGAGAAIPALIGRLTSDPQDYIRYRSGSALVAIGAAPVPGLAAALRGGNPAVRCRIIELLGKFGADSELAATLLVESLQDPDDVIRRVTVRVLANRLRSEDEGVRLLSAHVVLAAGRAGTPILLAESQEEDWQETERMLAAVTLLRDEGRTAVAGLIEALGESEVERRARAAAVLGAIGPHAGEAVSALVAALEDENRQVCEAAASALGQIGIEVPDVVAALIRALSDEDADIRLSAVETLRGLRAVARSALPALRALDDDPEEYVRNFAGFAIHDIEAGNEPAEPNAADEARLGELFSRAPKKRKR